MARHRVISRLTMVRSGAWLDFSHHPASGEPGIPNVPKDAWKSGGRQLFGAK